jgi:hypothetical protein
MDVMVTGRRGGKTTKLVERVLDCVLAHDELGRSTRPQGETIKVITCNRMMAEYVGRELARRLPAWDGRGGWEAHCRANRVVFMSIGQVGYGSHRGWNRGPIFIDDLEQCLASLLGQQVEMVTATATLVDA